MRRFDQESLDRVGRSHDLPDANRLLASSPASPNIVSLSVRLLYNRIRLRFGLQKFLCAYNLDKQHTAYDTWENDGRLCLICMRENVCSHLYYFSNLVVAHPITENSSSILIFFPLGCPDILAGNAAAGFRSQDCGKPVNTSSVLLKFVHCRGCKRVYILRYG
jgi:hypothetical protein